MADIKVRMNFDFIDFQKVGGKVIQDRNQPDEVVWPVVPGAAAPNSVWPFSFWAHLGQRTENPHDESPQPPSEYNNKK
jgi:hypothetical protein